MPSSDMNAFKEHLAKSKRIIAVAGAGLSAASGIPTFRGAGGMWRKYDAMSLATPKAFAANPSLVWQFYHMRREKARQAIPNAAHHALAHFSITQRREEVVPQSTFTLITQNVDCLSGRALDSVISTLPDADAKQARSAAGDTDHPAMLEMHGRIFDVACTACGHTELDYSSPVCEALRGTEDLMDAGATDPTIAIENLPRCKKCEKLARPGVVWFEEMPQHLDTISDLLEADLCIVVGTSSTVYPAAGFADQVAANGGKVAVFNLLRSDGDDEADFLFLGPCEETLPIALSMEKWLN